LAIGVVTPSKCAGAVYKMEVGSEKAKRGATIAIVVLALIGLGLSSELLRIHLTVAKSPSHGFACTISEKVDCNAVALSRQAVLLNLPVPVWAIGAYLAVAVLGVIGLISKKAPWRTAPEYALAIGATSVLYSAYLAYVSAFVLETLCIYCAGLYAVNIGLLVTGVLVSRPLKEYVGRRMDDMQWLAGNSTASAIAGLAVLAALFTISGLYVWSRQPEVISLGPGVKIDVSNDPVIGNPRAPVTIIEFSDFECPACRTMHEEVIGPLLRNYKSEVRLIHKDYPLDRPCNPGMTFNMHENACEAAAAAECARQKGRYESYSERLWKAEDLSVPKLLEMAKQEGLDPESFQQCMNSDETMAAIVADAKAGDAIGLEATPTFVINGYKFSGYKPLSWCTKLIERFLKGKRPPRASPIGENEES